MKKISIGVFCFNEEKNIKPMYEAITAQMKALPQYNYEILFEDNASKDSSPYILKQIAQSDSNVKVILHKANYGIERSSYHCMKNVSGDAFISMPCDFEEPPEMIPEFIEKWEEGYEVVLGQKLSSEESKVTYLLREQYYRIIDFFAEHKQIPQITGFGIYDRKVLDFLLDIRQYDAFLQERHLIAEYGFKLELLPYKHQKRKRGKSSYTPFTYLSFAINSLCNTSTKPLRLITLIGMFGTMLSGAVLFILSVGSILRRKSRKGRDTPFIAVIFLLSFLQVFCTGLLGEYIGVILRKVTHKPFVLEKERINFDK